LAGFLAGFQLADPVNNRDYLTTWHGRRFSRARRELASGI
jgi:hypothetical protein